MRKTLGNLCVLTSLFVFLGLAGAALAGPDRTVFEMTARLAELDRALRADPFAAIELPYLDKAEADAGDEGPVLRMNSGAPEPAVVGARFQMLDMRLPLAMIAQSHGGGDNEAVLTAQGPNGPNALVLREGAARMGDLAAAALAQNAARWDPDGALRLTRPLIVWDGAHLTLGPGDVLRLDRVAGAFVQVLGRMTTTDATIEGTVGENPDVPRFRPFVVAGSGGLLDLTRSRFTDLGFGHTEKFAGVAVVRNGLMMGRGRVTLDGNLFTRVGSVWIDTAQDAQITNNRFRAATKVPLAVTNAGRPVITGNVFFENGKFNAIQVLRGSYGAVIEDNVILGGERAGIVVKFDSHRAVIRRNVVWKRDGTGIIFAKSNCAVIARNWVLQNRQKGIELRTARGTEVRDNRLALNRHTGLWISAQASTAATLVAGNVFSQNRTGLTTATGAQLVIEGNDFSGQVPRFLSGDVATQNAEFARGTVGEGTMVLTAAGLTRGNAPATGCPAGDAS
ncbi:right-handed parallel beta-helix repeat-containing protein [Pseudaestuariivita atlantica]|uniref:Periplasmic copper-binding protein NosD beta helix domain-containing protein n=1 Tax=Pseudaestuariivita atlantica TaxID=1317121 RepID=A0A0L1JPG5_9RHOB|nr:right-handed parallel beta-helix repeat-containing protein [Pseudaestuariivita atlantica]KNG93298.1 hypothetical protein ATO11_12680 [Pseudaestuariivita atlantica]